LRHSIDLDLLVEPQHIPRAVELLRADAWEPRDAAMWLKGGLYRRMAEIRIRHLQLFQPQQKIGLELHWRVEAARSPGLEAKWWELWSESRWDLSCVECLHLCLHGTVHAWNRLKWLEDLAAISTGSLNFGKLLQTPRLRSALNWQWLRQSCYCSLFSAWSRMRRRRGF